MALRPLLAKGCIWWQFEVPLSTVPEAGLVGMLTVVVLELGDPWEGVTGLGREEEVVAGKVAGLFALSLTDSHSEAPLVLVHSELAGWEESFNLLHAGCTRYFKGRGPFCRGEVTINSRH